MASDDTPTSAPKQPPDPRADARFGDILAAVLSGIAANPHVTRTEVPVAATTLADAVVLKLLDDADQAKAKKAEADKKAAVDADPDDKAPPGSAKKPL